MPKMSLTRGAATRIPKVEPKHAAGERRATGGEVSHAGRVKASTGKQHTLAVEKRAT
jgi:hypothetical protein